MLAKELANGRAFEADQQFITGQARVDDLKIIILAGAGQEEGILREGFVRGWTPASARERPVDPFVVQLRPKKSLELVFALKVFQDAENCSGGLMRLADIRPPRKNCRG